MLRETPYAAGIVPCAIDLAVTKTIQEKKLTTEKETLKGETAEKTQVKNKCLKQQKENNSGEIIQLKDKTISTSSSGNFDRKLENIYNKTTGGKKTKTERKIFEEGKR